MIEFLCHKCSSAYEAPGKQRGQQVNCPKCGAACVVEPAIKHKCQGCGAMLASAWECAGREDVCPVCKYRCHVPLTKEQRQEQERRRKAERQRAAEEQMKHLQLAKQREEQLERTLQVEAKRKSMEAEVGIAAYGTAAAACEALVKIHAHLQVGITLDQYASQLGDALHLFGEFCSQAGGQFPTFSGLMKDAFGSHSEALDIWRQMEAIGGGGAGMIGGGFGIEGALIGMAIAGLVNSVAASDKRSKVEKLDTARSYHWNRAQHFLEGAADIVDYAESANPRLPGIIAGETCANCGRSIGKLEKPYKWHDHLVCAQCHRVLED